MELRPKGLSEEDGSVLGNRPAWEDTSAVLGRQPTAFSSLII